MQNEKQVSTAISSIEAAGVFDNDWYRATYPDVDGCGMDPVEHYVRYGAAMGRDPSRAFSTLFFKNTHDGNWSKTANPLMTFIGEFNGQMAPNEDSVLKAANMVLQRGEVERAIEMAECHLPDNLAYTTSLLRANVALANGDEHQWLTYLNAYLERFSADGISLRASGDTLFNRLTTKPFPMVTGGPKISVIMPAWNAADTIDMAANSILAQTWQNLELLIVDDCSSDGTWGHMQRLAAQDDRVKILRNKVNVGPYASKNIAVSLASGDWITGHDSDDWAHPQRLETHISEVQKQDLPPRASIQCMLRLLPNGEVDRFSKISYFCLDGAAREAPISCLFKADFLRKTLGSWDSVRFGADSELMGRAQMILGNEFQRFPRISMFAMSAENSLTNDPENGVNRITGPSKIRKDYAASWRTWHKSIDVQNRSPLHISFPVEGGRNFDAPEKVVVPAADTRRNHAAETGFGLDDIPVTAICSSKRPEFARQICQQLNAQVHPNLHVVFIAHGEGHDPDQIKADLSDIASATVLEFPDPDAPLGDALNLGIDAATSDVLAKIDDDDFYGPNYIRSSLAGLVHSSHEGVGIVGRGRAYCYIEDRDALYIRFGESVSNRLRPRVFGGTIVWSRKALGDQRFQSIPRAVDTAFFKDAMEKDVKIMSLEPYDYIHVRYAQTANHTWKIDSEEFLKPATFVADGLRLDLAWSSQTDPARKAD